MGFHNGTSYPVGDGRGAGFPSGGGEPGGTMGGGAGITRIPTSSITKSVGYVASGTN